MMRLLKRACASFAALGLFVLAAGVAGPRGHIGRARVPALPRPAAVPESPGVLDLETAPGETVRFELAPGREPLTFVARSAESLGLPRELRGQGGRLLASYATGGARLVVLEEQGPPEMAARALGERLLRAGWSDLGSPTGGAAGARLFSKPGWRCLAHAAPAPGGGSTACITACLEPTAE